MASSGASSFRESRSRSSSVSASRSRSRGSNYRASRSRTSSPSAPSSGDEKLVTIQQANANANGNGRPGPKIAPSQTVRDVKKAIAEELGEELDDDLSLAFGFNWLDDGTTRTPNNGRPSFLTSGRRSDHRILWRPRSKR